LKFSELSVLLIMSDAYVSVAGLRKVVLAGCNGPALDKLSAVFRAPSFFLHHNHLGFYTGDKIIKLHIIYAMS
jgi:hypothetical protein